MIINIGQLTFTTVATICVLAFSTYSFAENNEQTPPFLLIDAPVTNEKLIVDTSETTSPSNIKQTTPSTNIENKDTLNNNLVHDDEQSPPFLLIDDVSTEKEIEPEKNIGEIYTAPTPYKPERPSSGNDEDLLDESEDDFLNEDIVVATEIAKPPFFSFLDDHQKLISDYLHITVLSVDNFFATNEAINESTGSHLRITVETLWPEGDGAKFDGSISLRARLPGIREKYRLVIESDPDETKELLELESRNKNLGTSENQNDGVYTGLEKNVGYFGWKVRPSLGVKFRSPLDTYARLRMDRSHFFDRWALYLHESLYWFDSSGFGFDSTMRWDRPLNYMYLFRTTSLLRYTDLTDIYDLSQTAEIIQTINHRQAITYKVGVFANSDNSLHTTDYLVNLLYRNNIHSDYLFFDIQPQILFNKDNNFEAEHELLFRIELYYRD